MDGKSRFAIWHRIIPDFPRRPTNLTPNDPTDPYAHYTADHLYEFLATYELTRTPGDTYEYSHVGAGLLGHALAVRAGNTDYESLVRARILGPLRMDDTVIAVPHRLRDRVAVAHDDNLDPVPDWNLGVLAGAGGLFEVTTRDGRLYVQRSGQSPLRAFPMSEWRFFHKAVNAQLMFEPGGDSYAARLVLHQSGSDQT
jgi:CubicO group peptidase (beta-lactamase class C family)